MGGDCRRFSIKTIFIRFEKLNCKASLFEFNGRYHFQRIEILPESFSLNEKWANGR
ncbi:conserved hypothetical protein [Burkholderia pseudomallei MSHR346]|nr:conserved hypothetical protein [Burkholderia pseudomallei MSHR346]